MEKGRSGRGRCIGYNLSHMADLKKTASRSHNHSLIALWLFRVIKLILKHVFSYVCLSQTATAKQGGANAIVRCRPRAGVYVQELQQQFIQLIVAQHYCHGDLV